MPAPSRLGELVLPMLTALAIETPLKTTVPSVATTRIHDPLTRLQSNLGRLPLPRLDRGNSEASDSNGVWVLESAFTSVKGAAHACRADPRT